MKKGFVSPDQGGLVLDTVFFDGHGNQLPQPSAFADIKSWHKALREYEPPSNTHLFGIPGLEFFGRLAWWICKWEPAYCSYDGQCLNGGPDWKQGDAYPFGVGDKQWAINRWTESFGNPWAPKTAKQLVKEFASQDVATVTSDFYTFMGVVGLACVTCGFSQISEGNTHYPPMCLVNFAETHSPALAELVKIIKLQSLFGDNPTKWACPCCNEKLKGWKAKAFTAPYDQLVTALNYIGKCGKCGTAICQACKKGNPLCPTCAETWAPCGVSKCKTYYLKAEVEAHTCGLCKAFACCNDHLIQCDEHKCKECPKCNGGAEMNSEQSLLYSSQPPWEHRMGKQLNSDCAFATWREAWEFYPEFLDPGQAAADYYLLEPILSNALVNRDLMTTDLKVLAMEAKLMFDELVHTYDDAFIKYVDLAVGGELRHHMAFRPPRVHMTRHLAWVGWRNVRDVVGVEALRDAAFLFRQIQGGGVGGERWAIGADYLYMRLTNQITPAQFCDRVFTLAHNGGAFLNKVIWDGYMGRMPEVVRKYIGPAHDANPPQWNTLLFFASPEVAELWRDYVPRLNYQRLRFGDKKFVMPRRVAPSQQWAQFAARMKKEAERVAHRKRAAKFMSAKAGSPNDQDYDTYDESDTTSEDEEEMEDADDF